MNSGSGGGGGAAGDLCDAWPGIGGGGGADGVGGGTELGIGGAAEGSGGGFGAAWSLRALMSAKKGRPSGGSGACSALSNELTELTEVDLRWPSFLGRFGGTFGTFSDAGGGGADGTGGGTGGAAGGGAAGVAVFGGGGTLLGGGGTLIVGGGAPGTGGATASFRCGRVVGADGAAGVGAVGIFGADAGTSPLRLSLTDLSFGMPPAKMSPSCGADGTGPCSSVLGAALGTPAGAVFSSIIGFDLSTVTAFFKRVPLRMSPSNASRPLGMDAGGPARSSGGPISGGGGGGGGPAMM